MSPKCPELAETPGVRVNAVTRDWTGRAAHPGRHAVDKRISSIGVRVDDDCGNPLQTVIIMHARIASLFFILTAACVATAQPPARPPEQEKLVIRPGGKGAVPV